MRSGSRVIDDTRSDRADAEGPTKGATMTHAERLRDQAAGCCTCDQTLYDLEYVEIVDGRRWCRHCERWRRG